MFGNGRDHSTAMINIDLEAVGNWAERRGLAYTGYIDLASQDDVYHMIKDCVDKVNEDLSRESHLANSQIHRFLILHKELDADDGELTRKRYDVLVDALYSDLNRCHVETRVTFEDGRSGVLKADVKIWNAHVYPAGTPTQEAAA